MIQTALKLKIEGMHCDACVRRVTTALTKIPSVQLDHVAIGEASIDYDASSLEPQTIVDAVNAIGFQAAITR